MITDYMKHRLALKNGQAPPQEKKKPAKIRPVSKKREKINAEYFKKTRPLWKNKACAARTPKCTKKAQGMHHLEGKESTAKLLNTDEMIPCCNACNTWIEENDAQARRMGLKKSKFKRK